jgi:large subunit ribosomal protein L21
MPMYAVIRTGGKQYRVKPGDTLVVEKLPGEAGAKVSFDEVLMVGEGADVTVGAPLVEGASVTATLVETRKGEKVKIFKKIRRQGYRRTRGHRQFETVLRVTAVAGAGKSETWDGQVDLTPRAVLNARARGLKTLAEALMAESTLLPVAKAKPAARKAAAPKAKAAPDAPEAAPAGAEAPAKPAAKKAAAPKKAAEAKAEETPAKKAPAKKSKPAADGGEA